MLLAKGHIWRLVSNLLLASSIIAHTLLQFNDLGPWQKAQMRESHWPIKAQTRQKRKGNQP